MKFITRTLRLIRINYILARYNIDEIILGNHWFYPARAIIYLNPFYWLNGNKLSRGQRIRLAIEKLGPIFVKAGQIISTRRDIIPDDIANELEKLQDRVPPFSGKLAKKAIEEALNCQIEHVFAEFDPAALASASIAQVHAATLFNGDKVIIKVLRPNIDPIIERDIDLLRTIANIANRYWQRARHFKSKEIIDEIAQTLNDELDLMRESANAAQLRRNFEHSAHLYIPKIYWEYCRPTILVSERIFGIPIHDTNQLRQAGFDLQQIAERGVEIFFTQIFRDNFFHADLHPGNLFIAPHDIHDPKFIAVDFGIVGSLSQEDQRYIAENMMAFINRDYQRVAELHIACGWIPPDTRIDQFEGAIRAVSEPIFQQPLRDISFGKLLMQLFHVARRFNINIQPQLVLLQKTLLSIEGLSRQLAPELDLWQTAKPQIEKWLRKQKGPKAFIKRLRENLPLLAERLPDIPILLHEVLQEKKRRYEAERFEQNNPSVFNQSIGLTKLLYFFGGIVMTLAVLWLVKR